MKLQASTTTVTRIIIAVTGLPFATTSIVAQRFPVAAVLHVVLVGVVTPRSTGRNATAQLLQLLRPVLQVPALGRPLFT